MLALIVIEVHIIAKNYLLGVALNGLGRKQDAIKDYTKAIDVDQKLDHAYWTIASYNLARRVWSNNSYYMIII